MDPLSALGLAANIVQFVEVSNQLLSASISIYQGPPPENIESLQTHARLLGKQLEELNKTVQTSDQDEELLQLTRSAESLLREIQDVVQKIQPNGERSRTRSRVIAASRFGMRAREVKELDNRLKELTVQITLRLIQRIRTSTPSQLSPSEGISEASALLDNLDAYSRSAVTALLNQQETGPLAESDVTYAISAGALINRLEGRTLNPTRSEESIRQDVEEALLRSLGFDTWSDRMAEIAAPSTSTFEWVFKQPKDSSWDSLTNWLCRDSAHSGLYWINGNEASGKSTLMKHIFTHPDTTALLTKWAGPVKLVTAAFFFWRGGSRLEKSQEGLLRSLLFTILRSHRHLLADAFPREWAKLYSQISTDPSTPAARVDTWNIASLREALELLGKQNQYPLKVFLLVDGLDEYEGKELSGLIDLFLARTTQSPNFKILVSSRLLKDFDTFRANKVPSLTLHELNAPGIKIHVRETLEQTDPFESAAEVDPVNAAAVVDHILRQSNGLFLWTKLAVQVVQSELDSGSSFRDILESLNQGLASADLDSLYSNIWSRIPIASKQQASRILQIVLISREVRELHPTLSDDEEPLNVVDLLFADGDPQDTVALPIDFWPDGLIEARCNSLIEKFIKVWPGFITVHPATGTNKSAGLPKSRIRYSHRSVLEFWTGKGKSLLQDAIQDPPFNPYLAHIKSAVHRLKVLPSPLPPDPLPLLWNLVTLALVSANKVEKQEGHLPNTYGPLLDALDGTMTHHHEHIQLAEGSRTYRGDAGLTSADGGWKSAQLAKLHWSNLFPSQYTPSPRHTMRCQDSFLSLLVQFGLNRQVESRLDEREGHRKLCGKNGRPLLSYALDPHPIAKYDLITADTVKLLLDRGADPNAKFNKSSCWQDALRWQYGALAVRKGESGVKGAVENKELARIRLKIITLLMERGVKTINFRVPLFEGKAALEAKEVVMSSLGPWVSDDDEDYRRDYDALLGRFEDKPVRNISLFSQFWKQAS